MLKKLAWGGGAGGRGIRSRIGVVGGQILGIRHFRKVFGEQVHSQIFNIIHILPPRTPHPKAKI